MNRAPVAASLPTVRKGTLKMAFRVPFSPSTRCHPFGTVQTADIDELVINLYKNRFDCEDASGLE
jgi:hypothetical protein